ncbi:tetratricopeptide repeat protein, partial [Oscillatoriales cyanobacterium LEGE 11467]
NGGNFSLETIHAAICAYDRAMEYFTGESSPSTETTTAIAVELGNLYWMLSRGFAEPEEKCRYLKQSLEFHRSVLVQIKPPHPLWMPVQNHLGGLYADLARYEDAAENLHQSAIAFEEVLRLKNGDGDSLQYATTQNSLGTTYWSLAQHREPVRYLQQAIAAYCQALEIYTPQQNNPQKNAIDYAMVLNNLGTAYWTLSRHDRTFENLLLAVDAYCKALKHRTRETLPVGCAATQNNLATAYWHLAQRFEAESEQAIEYLQQAIAAYETAVTVAESVGDRALPFDLLAAYNNLGLARYQWVTHPHFDGTAESRQNHLEAALQHHLLALAGWKQQPERYKTALDFVVRTIRAFYNDGDIQTQNLAFSQLPSDVLPEVMKGLWY